MTPQKKKNFFLVTNLREMNICNLSNKEFKIAVLRKFGELSVNIKRQFSETRKPIHEQNNSVESLNIEILKNSPIER